MKVFLDLLLLVLIVAAAAAYFGKLPQLQLLSDNIEGRFHQSTYQPPADVATLADQAQMTDAGKDIFYQTEPVIDTDRATFNRHCQSPVSSNVVELGCYTSDNHIYILKIDDPNLQSEMVVVAAHEMLHAAYAKLLSSDQTMLNSMLEVEVVHLHSSALNQEIRTYRLTEPGQRDNELHSLLGTEYYPLDTPLENYYTKYFKNRQAVTSDHQHFQSVFDNLQAQLDTLQSQIHTDRQLMDTYLRRGDVRSYNALVPTINSRIDHYNQVADQYNRLSRSLAGTEAPTTTQ